MSSEITSEYTTATYYGVDIIETELTLGLPGEKQRLSVSTPLQDNVEQLIGLYRKNAGKKNFKLVKVAVDGAPYLRKVDLESYSGYQDLECALFDMFSFIIENVLNEKLLMDLVNRIKYASMYEDKDGDWMLVGDVSWKMFVQTCKRIRVMRSSEAVTSSVCSS